MRFTDRHSPDGFFSHADLHAVGGVYLGCVWEGCDGTVRWGLDVGDREHEAGTVADAKRELLNAAKRAASETSDEPAFS